MKTSRWIVCLLGLFVGGGLFAADQTGEEPVNIGQVKIMPRAVKREPPVYPYGMWRAGLAGRVMVEFVIDKEGNVINPHVVRSNNPWFERAALDAILKWKFIPGQVDGRKVNVRAGQLLEFAYEPGSGSDGLWSVPKRKEADKNLPEELQWVKPPEPTNTAFPVYPLAALQAKQAGRTKINFLINRKGRVEAAQVMEATTPEMGLATLAMIDTWEFTPPAKKDGTPCLALIAIDHKFKPSGDGDVPVTHEAREILRLLEKSPANIATLAELDRIPKALSRRQPVYPTALEKAGQAGQAMIEFFIDRNGDAQLPRIVSSSAPEFGYAAVQAVATWRFEPALKDGKIVVARAQIPMEFKLGEAR